MPNSISFTTSFCSSFKLIFPFAFRKTLIESKLQTHLPPHGRASRRARITDRFWLTFTFKEPISISRPPADGQLENASLRAGGHSRPLPHPLPSNFSPPFEFVQHGATNRIRLIEFSAFSQDRQLRRLRSKFFVLCKCPGTRDTINCQMPGLPGLIVYQMPGFAQGDARCWNWRAHNFLILKCKISIETCIVTIFCKPN